MWYIRLVVLDGNKVGYLAKLLTSFWYSWSFTTDSCMLKYCQKLELPWGNSKWLVCNFTTLLTIDAVRLGLKNCWISQFGVNKWYKWPHVAQTVAARMCLSVRHLRTTILEVIEVLHEWLLLNSLEKNTFTCTFLYTSGAYMNIYDIPFRKTYPFFWNTQLHKLGSEFVQMTFICTCSDCNSELAYC